VRAIIASNVALTLIFASALQYLWGLVNALQIIVIAIFFDLLLPPNLQVIIDELKKACNFEFFETDDFYNEIFDFKETPNFSEKFEAVGIEGSNFIISMGTSFIFIVYFPS